MSQLFSFIPTFHRWAWVWRCNLCCLFRWSGTGKRYSNRKNTECLPLSNAWFESKTKAKIGSGIKWAECSLIILTGCRVQVLARSSIAQSVCQWAFSLLAIRCLRPWVRILHWAEEDNLSPFDSNIACLCQSIEINNNKHSIICHNCFPPFPGFRDDPA